MAAILAATVVAGCGGASGGGATGSGDAATPATKDAGGEKTFVYAVASVPEHLDLTPWGGQPSKVLYGVLDSTLMSYDTSKLPEDGCQVLPNPDDLKGNLVESWEIAPDRKSITMKLRDVKSSWGNQLTAQDVKWSVDRQAANQPFIGTALGKIGHYDMDNLVEVVDDKTVKFNLLKPTVFDLMQLTSLSITINDSQEIKKHATKQDPWGLEWMRTNTASYGPWKLERFSPGAEVVLTRNPHYTGERGNIDKVILRAVPDSATRTQLLRSGDVDWADNLTFNEYAQLRDTPGVTVENCVSADRDDILLQQKDKRLADPRVRQAISMAINRDVIVKSIYRDFGQAAKHGIPQAYQFTDPEQQYTYDPEGAKQLLAEAGHPNGFSFTALISETRPGPHVQPVAVQIQSDLKKIGIDMKLQRVPGAAEFFELVNGGRYDATFYADSTYVADASYGAAAFTLSTSNINSFNYRSKEYDDLVFAAQAEAGPERAELLKKVAEKGVTDMPIVYIVDSANVQAHRSDVTGFTNIPNRTINPAQYSIDR